MISRDRASKDEVKDVPVKLSISLKSWEPKPV